MTKTIKLEAQLELLDKQEENTAFSSVTTLNPSFQWAKLVVTDDQPNLNKQRIPLEEYENLSQTGVHTPIKMAKTISGHEDATPIGTLTHLKTEGNRLLGLAALWKREREQDVNMLKQMYVEGKPPNVSWEVSYAESKEDNEGVNTLYGTALNGISIVANPAYAGRARFVAMSEKNTEVKGDKKVDELEKAMQKIMSLEEKVSSYSDYEDIKIKLQETENELLGLREFKASVDKEHEDAQKLAQIKQKFSEAGLDKNEEYLLENKELFLSMSEEAVNFMIQELVAFSESKKEKSKESETKATTEIPNIINSESVDASKLDPVDLGRALRSLEKQNK